MARELRVQATLVARMHADARGCTRMHVYEAEEKGAMQQRAPSRREHSPARQPLRFPQPVVRRKPSSWLKDVFGGAVLGDFATEVHLPGAVTHAALGFVPVIGTVTALRDFVACWLDADGLGMVLNLLAVIPVFGGVPKTRCAARCSPGASALEAVCSPQGIRRDTPHGESQGLLG